MKFIVVFSMLFPDFGDNGNYIRTTQDMDSWFKMPFARVDIRDPKRKMEIPQATAYSNTLEVINPYRSIEINTFKRGFGLSAYTKPQLPAPSIKLQYIKEQQPEILYTWGGR